MKTQSYKKLIRRLNKRLFYQCYKIERKIAHILVKPISLLQVVSFFSYYLLIVSLVVATIPRPVLAKDELISSIKPDLESIIAEKPIVAGAYEKRGVDLEDMSGTLPQSPKREPVKAHKLTVTFYSSTPDQTDSTPFITANGTHVYDGVAAANFLPFGTKVMLPELFGNKVFVIEDRMHERFSHRVDIWVSTREEALKRGVAYTTVEIYE